MLYRYRPAASNKVVHSVDSVCLGNFSNVNMRQVLEALMLDTWHTLRVCYRIEYRKKNRTYDKETNQRVRWLTQMELSASLRANQFNTNPEKYPSLTCLSVARVLIVTGKRHLGLGTCDCRRRSFVIWSFTIQHKFSGLTSERGKWTNRRRNYHAKLL